MGGGVVEIGFEGWLDFSDGMKKKSEFGSGKWLVFGKGEGDPAYLGISFLVGEWVVMGGVGGSSKVN